jgi:hypothetical protein
MKGKARRSRVPAIRSRRTRGVSIRTIRAAIQGTAIVDTAGRHSTCSSPWLRRAGEPIPLQLLRLPYAAHRAADLQAEDTVAVRQAAVHEADLHLRAAVILRPGTIDANTFHPVPLHTSLTVRRLRKEPPAPLFPNVSQAGVRRAGAHRLAQVFWPDRAS